MIKALLDINVILDVLQKRAPHYESSSEVLSLCAESQINGYLSATSFGTLHYVLSKFTGKAKSLSAIKKLRAITSVAAVDDGVIDLAASSNFTDFEDAIQYYSAVRNGIDQIITRNKKDFAKSMLAVSTPEDFLKTFASTKK